MAEQRKILVTGAGGFVGGRIVEVLHSLGSMHVRAGVRRWASAARIGRYPVEIARCDVTDPEQCDAALEGVDGVVHCAVGDRTATVDGTRTLLEAAQRASVERFVHISTIDVYGPETGSVSEDHPLTYSGKEYADNKIDAEKEVWRAAENGLPIAVLRPTLIYGPFSESWTIEWAKRLQARPWMLSPDDCGGTCNLLYVDDLVSAILLALSKQEAVGQAFNVNGAESPTWQEYFEALNDALGLPALDARSAATSHLSAHLMAPVRAAAKLALAKLEDPIMKLYQRYDLAKAVMLKAEGAIRKTPTSGEFEMLSRRMSFPTDKAAESLGYVPAVPLAKGLELSVAWLRHHGFVADAL